MATYSLHTNLLQIPDQLYVAVNIWGPHLPCGEMCEHLQQLDAFLYGGDGGETSIDDIVHHHFQVLQSQSELAVIVMPTAAFDIQNGLANSFQAREELLKGVFDLSYASHEIRSTTPTKAGNRMFLALVAPCKKDLWSDKI